MSKGSQFYKTISPKRKANSNHLETIKESNIFDLAFPTELVGPLNNEFDIRTKFYMNNCFDKENSEKFLKEKNRCLKEIHLSDEIIDSKKELVIQNINKVNEKLKIPENEISGHFLEQYKLNISKGEIISFTFRGDEE